MLRSTAVKPTRLLVIANPLAKYLRHLEKLPDETVITVSDKLEGLQEAAPEADALLLCTGRNDLLKQLWPSMRNLKWMHSFYAGLENTLFDELVHSPVTLTNAKGVFRKSLAEFSIMAMLWFAKDAPRMRGNQKIAKWEPYDIEMLEGSTLGILGYGQIGRATAKLAKAFGMHVIGISRSSKIDDYADEVVSVEHRGDALSRCNYIQVATALTPQTRGLLGASEFARLKEDAVIINVGRGPVIVESELIKALEHKKIRGAALDVFDVEPLPQEHPFWRLDNVLLSPHSADHTANWTDDALQFFVQNFEHYRKGEPLENIVDKHAGY